MKKDDEQELHEFDPPREFAKRLQTALGPGRSWNRHLLADGTLILGAHLPDNTCIEYAVDPELDPRQVPYQWARITEEVERRIASLQKPGKARERF